MHTAHPSAFTIVEALVATAVVGIASAAFAVSLAANSLIRARAGARVAAAQFMAARVALLAVRSCAAGSNCCRRSMLPRMARANASS